MSDTVMFFAITYIQLFLYGFQWSEICRCKLPLPAFVTLIFLVNAGTDAFSLYVLDIPHGNIPYTIVQTAILFTVMWLSFDGTIREKIRLIIVGALLALLTELSSMLILFLAFDVRYYNYQEPSEELSAMQLISIDDFLVCIGIMIFIMNRKQEGFREIRRYLVMIPLFAVSHMIYLILYYRSGVELINQNLSLQLMLQALMCFLLIGFYRLVKQHLARYKAEERLRQMESSMHSTHEYYQLAHEKFEEIMRIRHDFRNQMQTVERLIADGHTAEAQKSISLIEDEIENTRLPSYCSDPVVDALLTVKLNEPENARIRTEIILEDIELLPLDPYEICSLFSNLIDNAFAAAREEKITAPFVRIRSGIRGGMFLLKVENSIDPDVPLKHTDDPAHGYGLQIIETITGRHSGSFRITREEQTVTALVAFPVSQI